jgi:major membrane immunogen (membrane-anchored lipoprotein)
MKYLFFIAVIGLLAACSGNSDSGKEVYKDEIKKLDTYKEQLDVEVKSFLALDSNKINQIHADYEEMKRVLKAYYKVDTIDVKFAAKVNGMKGLKDTKHFPANKVRFLKAADLTFQQIEDLTHDLTHQSIEEDEIEEAMKLESKAAEEIIGVLHSYTELLSKNLAMYDTLNPPVQIVVDSLRNLHEGTH